MMLVERCQMHCAVARDALALVFEEGQKNVAMRKRISSLHLSPASGPVRSAKEPSWESASLLHWHGSIASSAHLTQFP